MNKRSQRSSPYPSYTLERCIELVATIYNNFGGTNYFAKREEIAQVVGVSAANVQTKVSSAKQYNLLELKSGMGYRPSSLFVSIYRPINEESKKEAIIEAFKSPALYSALIAQYENEMIPSEVPLSNIILHHHNISEGANIKAASIFIENARSLGLLTSENILTLSNKESGMEDIVEAEDIDSEHNTYSQQQLEKTDFSRNTSEPIPSPASVSGKKIPFNIPLKGKRTAQILVPEDVRSTDFDFIINFINLMKQQYE